MSDHFFISEFRELLSSGRAVLTGSEAQHVARVLRKKPGEELLLFDGSGREFVSVIEQIQKDRIDLTVKETRFDDREPETDLTMAVALPKGERQKWLLEKLTELGVRRYIPVRCDRADVKFDNDVLDRLKRQVIEASKQCGRLRLMDVLPEMSRREIAEHFPFEPSNSQSHEQEDRVTILAHPISDGFFGQKSFPDLLTDLRTRSKMPRHILIVIGPVGGWTDEEVQSAVDDNWPILDLGKQVYRVETAALVAAALFLHL